MKKETIVIVTLPILCAIIVIIAYARLLNTNIDALKFKKEYERFNSEGFIEINIDKNNPFLYADYDKILEIIDKGTGVIYLGFPECPWCRNAVPVLIDVALKNKVDIIYYMNILNERDSYVVIDDKLEYAKDENGNDKKGSEGYFKLLSVLDNFLSDYVVSYNGKEYEVNEKRIYAPSIIFVKNGKILGIHVSTVESQTDPNIKLTDKQYNELYSIYEDYIIEIKSGTCDLENAC